MAAFAPSKKYAWDYPRPTQSRGNPRPKQAPGSPRPRRAPGSPLPNQAQGPAPIAIPIEATGPAAPTRPKKEPELCAWIMMIITCLCGIYIIALFGFWAVCVIWFPEMVSDPQLEKTPTSPIFG